MDGPRIALVYPTVSDVKVSAKNVTCNFTITDTLSGVGSVVFKNGSTILTDTLHSGDNYQCIVKDLVQGEKTILTIEAYDKSMKKTKTTLNVSLTYDPDMVDNVLPKIVMKSPLTTTAVVSTSETSIQVIGTDESGIDTVTARKGTAQLTVERSDSLYSVVVSGLTAGKTDTIVFEATDKSSAKNKAPLSVYITFDASSLDTKGPKITLKSPASNNTKVSSPSVTLSVICSDENKVASVTYKTGTLSGNMTAENDSVFTATIIGLVSGENKITVTAKDKSSRVNSTDSVFTVIYDPTMNDTGKPVITCLKAVRDTLLVNVASTTIEVLCTDSSGIDKVTCTMGTSAIPVTAGSGGVYSAAMTGLAIGVNALIFTATDKAAKPNSDSKTIVVMYDPTATDVTGPVIKLSNPSQDRSKVAQASVKLVVVCNDDNGIGAVNYTFGTVNGVMTKDNDSTYSVALANLVQGDNQITILATDTSSKKNANDTVFTIVYDPTMNDNAAPVITLKTPEKDSTKVSSKSITIEVVCNDSSGIDTVTCKMGTSDVPVANGTAGVYSASVTTLAVGANTFTFTATDKASTKHSSTKAVTIVYDPSMTDNVAPKVVIKNPQSADQRVLTDTITVQLECTDDNNISSVIATRGGVALSGITNAGSLYSLKVTELRAGISDTINFKVVDNSSNKIAKDFPVILRYNRNPIAATLGTPADSATGVAKSPTFTWTDGTDPDGDKVTYTLRYGTSETALTKTVPNLTAGTTTLATALSGAIEYYWQVVTYTAVNGDSAVSKISSFTTVENAPFITAEPTTQSVDLGNKGTFSVTATGLNLNYQW
ncbi:MAG TPA: Ig-like domain-containing protein, partial [Chitinispirillaceae bacterium]|nr:Ig-like domain-containing protein [Chitinispirillaceae bacterium]